MFCSVFSSCPVQCLVYVLFSFRRVFCLVCLSRSQFTVYQPFSLSHFMLSNHFQPRIRRLAHLNSTRRVHCPATRPRSARDCSNCRSAASAPVTWHATRAAQPGPRGMDCGRPEQQPWPARTEAVKCCGWLEGWLGTCFLIYSIFQHLLTRKC